MSKKYPLVIDAREFAFDVVGLSAREIGVYMGLLVLRRVWRGPVPCDELVKGLAAHPGETERWIIWALHQLEDKGKITISEDGVADVAERRYRHQLLAGEVV